MTKSILYFTAGACLSTFAWLEPLDRLVDGTPTFGLAALAWTLLGGWLLREYGNFPQASKMRWHPFQQGIVVGVSWALWPVALAWLKRR